MIDPAALAHEPTDAELARRVALLDLPADDPRRQWEDFRRHLDRPTALLAHLLQRWLGGRQVTVTDLQTRLHGHRQYRVVSLVTPYDGMLVPLCHSSAVVELDRLPVWLVDQLLRTEQPLSRTLHRVGAVLERTTATVLDADPDALGDAGLKVRGAFRSPSAGGRLLATVEEYFTGYVLELHPAHAAKPVPTPRDRSLDDLDTALVQLLRRRRELAATRGLRHRPAPAVDRGAEHLHRQLVQLFGREEPLPDLLPEQRRS
jgi:hypothetical protein